MKDLTAVSSVIDQYMDIYSELIICMAGMYLLRKGETLDHDKWKEVIRITREDDMYTKHYVAFIEALQALTGLSVDELTRMNRLKSFPRLELVVDNAPKAKDHPVPD